jgi:glycosyltransferase involved in cell wall biosynthesis
MPRVDLTRVFRRNAAAPGARAPNIDSEDPPGLPVFCIVTPVFNGVTYIDDTIQSVLSQAGDFAVHYHIQDGGSTDGTMDRVRLWMKLSEQLPKVNRKLVFTCASEPDAGMYDAINKGFARAQPAGDDVVMGWIAADDRIAPGAFAAIAEIRSTFADIRFLGGRISLLGESGAIIGVLPIYPYSQRCMAAGLYDGRALPFVMQEGSFWCADLWHKAGGLDPRFRLAGDWDLWRRMAAHEPYIIADTILGFHRRRPGQLSEQMDRYYGEVDRLLEDAAPETPPAILIADDGHADGPNGAGSTPVSPPSMRRCGTTPVASVPAPMPRPSCASISRASFGSARKASAPPPQRPNW